MAEKGEYQEWAAVDLYRRYATDEDGLQKLECLVRGAWIRPQALSTYRHPGAPIIFETDEETLGPQVAAGQIVRTRPITD